jgi:hypothetical protein
MPGPRGGTAHLPPTGTMCPSSTPHRNNVPIVPPTEISCGPPMRFISRFACPGPVCKPAHPSPAFTDTFVEKPMPAKMTHSERKADKHAGHVGTLGRPSVPTLGTWHATSRITSRSLVLKRKLKTVRGAQTVRYVYSTLLSIMACLPCWRAASSVGDPLPSSVSSCLVRARTSRTSLSYGRVLQTGGREDDIPSQGPAGLAHAKTRPTPQPQVLGGDEAAVERFRIG